MTLADVVTGPGTIQEVNTATGQPVGAAYRSPSAQGYYTGSPFAATPGPNNTGSNLQPGQVLVNGQVLTETPNATGGYG